MPIKIFVIFNGKFSITNIFPKVKREMNFGHLFLSISGNLKIVLKKVVKISLLDHNALKIKLCYKNEVTIILI